MIVIIKGMSLTISYTFSICITVGPMPISLDCTCWIALKKVNNPGEITAEAVHCVPIICGM